MADDWFDLPPYVHQAAGMVAAQLNCDVEEAMTRLRVRAASLGRPVEQLALDVLDRVERFDA